MFEMLNTADPPLLYAVAGVIVLAVASLFGLVLFASREETFEDVVEKQRKAQEALLHSLQQGSSAKSGKQNRKWNKLKNKKASKGKGQEEHEIDSGVDDDELSTECVTISAPPPTIAVEEPPPAPAPSKKKKKGKKNKNQQQQDAGEDKTVEEHAKPVVVVEEEEVVVVEDVSVEEEVVVESTATEVEATPDVPSEDEVDITVDDEASDEETEEVPVTEEVAAEEEEEEEEEEVVVQEEPEVVVVPEVVQPVVAPPPKVEPVVVEKSKSSKKKKSNKQKSEAKPTGVIINSVEKLQLEIDNCNLNSDEVQQVMDSLLKKQNEFEQWQKPNQKSDPIEQLKKRIAEAEMQFAEERQSAQAIAGKMKELKLELQQERNHRQSIQNEATNRLNQQAKEAEAIRKRLEEKHLSEMHSAQSQIKRMQEMIDEGASNHMELQRMKEENAHLKNASMMAQQLAEDKQSLMTEVSQVTQTNKALRQEFDNLIIHHQQEMQNIQIAKVDSEGALSQRLQEMNDQLMKVEAHNRSLQLEMTEHQRLSEHQRMSEMENFQMAGNPSGDDSQELDELNRKLIEIQEKLNESELSVKLLQEQSESKSKELEGTCVSLSESGNKLTQLEGRLAESEQKLAEAEQKLTEHGSTEKEVEPVDTEVATLVAKVEEKDQLILVLEQKVTELEHRSGNSGQHSPDLVVVTPGDLLGSEPLLTSESFEEVVADKDYEDEIDNNEKVDEIIVPVEVLPEESGPNDMPEIEPEVVVVAEVSVEESVPDGFMEEADDKPTDQIEVLQEEIKERKFLESTLRENLTKLKAEYSKAEEKLVEAQHSLLEKDEAIAGHIADIAEKMCTINEHEAAVASKQAEIDILQSKISVHEATISSNTTELVAKDGTIAENMAKILELQESLSEKGIVSDEGDNSELNKIISEKDELIREWKEKAERLEETSTGGGTSNEELVEQLKTVKEELQGRVEATDELKMKNNELREKNWKVIDALAKAEQLNVDNTKSTEIRIIKGIKSIFPDIKIPKFDNDIELLFKEVGEKVVDNMNAKSEEVESETIKLKEVNTCLVEEINELKKTNELMNASQDEILKSQQENNQLLEENAHIKNVLIETESMLCRLQTGVDAEVQKWQKKVSEKDTELEVSKKSNEELKQILSKHGYEHENLTTLESSLSDGQKQLMAEKEENSRIKTELEEMEKNLTDTQKLLANEKDEHAKKVQELQENAMGSTNESEVSELNTKLKKTISERDLLIREYKNVKDNSTKMEAELNETKQSLLSKTQDSQRLSEEIDQLKGKITNVGTPTNNAVANDTTDKDELIKKLTVEIEELREELREERDCVIVDIDPDNSENLHKQVEVLSTELESEKQCKATLVSKLEDIEKSYQEDDAESDKVTDLESKLKLAEQKILELEADKKLLQKSTQKDGVESRTGTSV